MGADALGGESGPGVEACQGQQGRAWCGRHDHGTACPVAAGALGEGPGGPGRGHVPAVAGSPGGDPQARGAASACWECPRNPQTARWRRQPEVPESFVTVTHPFHPLSGRRLRVLFERKLAGG